MHRIMRLIMAAVVVVFACLDTAGAAETKPEDKPELEAAWARAFSPTLVTLSVKNASYDELERKLGKVVGQEDFKLRQSWERDKGSFTFTVKDEPFLKVVDRVKPVSPYVAYVGPVRLALSSTTYEESFVQKYCGRSYYSAASRTPAGLRLNFGFQPEPQASLHEIRLKLTEAVDDTGRDLLKAPAGREAPEGLGEKTGRVHGRHSPSYLLVDIYPAAAKAKKIQRIAGTFNITAMPPLPLVRISDLQRADQHIAGTPVTYMGMQERESGGRRYHWATFAIQDVPGLEDVNVRPTLVFKSGKEQGWRSMSRGRDEIRIGFPVVEGDAPSHILLKRPIPPRTKALEFEMTDIPLPPPLSEVRKLVDKTDAPERVETGWKPLPLASMPHKPVTYSGKDAAVQEVLRVLGEQTGNTIEFPGVYGGSTEAPKIDLDVKEAPLWQALDALAPQTGYRAMVYVRREKDPDHPGEYRQVPRFQFTRHGNEETAQMPDSSIAYRGPVRIALAGSRVGTKSSLNYRPPGTTPSRPHSQFTFSLTADAVVEPGVKLLRQGLACQRCVVGGHELKEEHNAHRPALSQLGFQDDRCKTMSSATYNYFHRDYFTPRLDAWPITDTIDLIRFYYFAKTHEGEKEIEIDPAKGDQTVQVEPGLSIRWLNKNQGEYSIEVVRRKPEHMLDTRILIEGKRIHAVDAAGKRHAPRYTRHNPELSSCSFRFPDKEAPARVLIQVPTGVRAYAGVVEFKDIPAPKVQPEQ